MHAYVKALVVIPIAVGLVPTDAQAQWVSRIEGSWVLNQAQSTCVGRGGCPRELVMTYEDRGGGMFRATSLENGRRTTYTARVDGNYYRLRGLPTGPPPAGGTRGYSTISFTRVDDYSSNWLITTNDGVVTARGTSTVSRDGQTFIRAWRGGSVLVFDRQ